MKKKLQIKAMLFGAAVMAVLICPGGRVSADETTVDESFYSEEYMGEDSLSDEEYAESEAIGDENIQEVTEATAESEETTEYIDMPDASEAEPGETENINIDPDIEVIMDESFDKEVVETAIVEASEEPEAEAEDLPASEYITVYDGIDYSLVYDFEFYVNRYADIAKAFNRDPELTLRHFVTYGMKEGRQASASFELTSYKNKYADLRKAYGNDNVSYYRHYIRYGYNEHRQTTGVTEIVNPITVLNGVDYSSIYDFNYYISKYSDLKKVFGNNDIGALNHFITYGMKEKRQASEKFDVNSYFLAYRDLRIAYQKNWSNYYNHYLKYGKKENRVTTGVTELRNPITTYKGTDYSSVYDYYFYTNKYSDIRKAYGQDDIGVMSHFVHYGMNEGRQGKQSYSVNNYNTLKAKSNEYIKEENTAKAAEEEARKKAEAEAKKRASDPAAAAALDKVGWNLQAAYNYAASLLYSGKTTYTESWGSYNLAQQGFSNHTGNCYVMAAVFYEMARLLDYEVHQIAGYIPLINGGETAHSWVEVVVDGTTYVCDPNLTQSRGNDAYMKPYGSKGIWKYQHYHRMN